jgi:hypothetical protein
MPLDSVAPSVSFVSPFIDSVAPSVTFVSPFIDSVAPSATFVSLLSIQWHHLYRSFLLYRVPYDLMAPSG